MDAAAVAQAFAVLNAPSTSAEDRRKADYVLRHWTLSRDAWLHCDEILRQPPDHGAALYAATSLRSKILYDIPQLSVVERELLQDSLLRHLTTAAVSSAPFPLVAQLGSAYAALSVHLAPVRPSVPLLIEHLNNQPKALIACLKALPEENDNPKLLCDPSARDIHAEQITSSHADVVKALTGLLDSPLAALALECYLEWTRFALDCDSPLGPSPFSGTFYAAATKLLDTDADVAAQILVGTLSRCSSSLLQVDPTFLERLSSDLTTPGAKLRTMLEEGIAQDDPIVWEIARIAYYVAWIQETILARALLEGNSSALALLNLLLQLAAVPYEPSESVKGVDGVASTGLSFWRCFIPSLRFPITEERLKGGDAVQSVLNSVTRILLQQCRAPASVLLNGSLVKDWIEFRQDVIAALRRLQEIWRPDVYLNHVITQLAAEGDLASQEALITAIRIGVAELPWDSTDPEQNPLVSPSGAPSAVIARLHAVLRGLPQLIETAETQPLPSAVTTKISIFMLIEASAGKAHLWEAADLLQTLVDVCARSIFQQTEISADQSEAKSVARSAAHAFSRLYTNYASATVLQQTIPQVLAMVAQRPRYPEEILCPVWEGIAAAVNGVESVDDFQKCTEESISLLVTCAGSAPPELLLSQLDRLSIFLRGFQQTLPERSNILFALYQTKIWPILQSGLQRHARWGEAIEKLCRVAKHSMRAVGMMVWAPAVPALAESVHSNSEVLLFSSYLYVAEWLFVYLGAAPDLRQGLQRLFDQLAGRAQTSLVAGDTTDEFVAEDLYGLFCRYIKCYPQVVAASPTFPQVLTPPPFVLSKGPALGMWGTMVGVAYHTLSAYGSVDDGELQEDQAVTRIFRNVLGAAVPEVVQRLFVAMQRVAFERVAVTLADALREVVKSKLPGVSEAIASNVAKLPDAVLATENNRVLISTTLQSEKTCAEEYQRLFEQCRQLNLRIEEALIDQ